MAVLRRKNEARGSFISKINIVTIIFNMVTIVFMDLKYNFASHLICNTILL
ncbi:hypothetical protein HMPREF9442_02182 [Paraprevotella xylaniphila YIT 11841]|uniref:Uncharacterized protein n=1 Tax=Paraprevotella xylaniphila YIT 11841 TaxID=762982 RepID=F3QVF6_9BACT|nr:hypothetical protein HMPREF9442_02182 [Paraprevotella xylaniphila YIT 11841]